MAYNNNGYNVEFLCDVDEKYRCIVCGNVLCYPLQFKTCGHRTCSGCLKEVLRSKSNPKCPIDGVNISIENVEEDEAIHQKILTFEVCCQRHLEGCNWTGLLNDLEKHLKKCQFEIIDCPKGCKEMIERQNIEKHISTNCSKREILCEFCKCSTHYDQLKSHWNACQMYLVSCPNSDECGKIARIDFDRHIRKDCKFKPIFCPFADEGCTYKGKVHDMEKHLEKDHLQHMIIFRDQIANQERIIQKQDEIIHQQENLLQDVLQRNEHSFTYYITEYSKQFNLARKCREHSVIYSDPFTVGKYGYKLSLVIFPNGNGIGKNKYLSVYLQLMRSEYDDILAWPFHCKVTIELIDQNINFDDRKNITFSLIPDKKRKQAAFMKPKNDTFTYFGSSMLASHKQLKARHYILNDTIYLKVVVKPTGDIGV
ncbi:uncharacterized protein TRIADDRAFT_27129 [Trichoplax adhaerens]|uniref:TNF receptor-associated factor n=1 Tax=Trichoplax adhaerens TaxID=10228 RepID=B3RYY7_TRIAD|nr:hypothetical protein TRIADDRAFT_27129 [Trichoplax adhaerens]EDV24108.1 hypothetical protein TRIADDRAFT_27129 [Trichoplax adhaerens]|eukprot:XP_002113634.1 hypothetical protein TRIADDRAFT_27129 [Trichoplax adhaerens]